MRVKKVRVKRLAEIKSNYLSLLNIVFAEGLIMIFDWLGLININSLYYFTLVTILPALLLRITVETLEVIYASTSSEIRNTNRSYLSAKRPVVFLGLYGASHVVMCKGWVEFIGPERWVVYGPAVLAVLTTVALCAIPAYIYNNTSTKSPT